MTDQLKWLPIDTAPQEFAPFNMFVVVALDVEVAFGGARYTSDPWSVWRGRDGSFERWPHSFSPTHWCPVPAYDPRRPKPKSLAEEAQKALAHLLRHSSTELGSETIRRALERLQELEGQG